jgi:hypothetical protein
MLPSSGKEKGERGQKAYLLGPLIELTSGHFFYLHDGQSPKEQFYTTVKVRLIAMVVRNCLTHLSTILPYEMLRPVNP